MAAVVESPPGPVRKISSTLLDLQLRRRDRRSKNFLLHLANKEVEAPAEVPPAPSPVAPAQPEPLKTPEQLAQWITNMANFDTFDMSTNDVKLTMPSGVYRDSPSIEPYPNLEKLKFTYKGGRDKEKRFHGKGIIELDNGCCITGEWKSGVRDGKFRLDASEGPIALLDGWYIQDKIQGKVRIQLDDGNWIIGYAKESVLHGFCRYFNADKKLEMVGMVRNGKPFGTCWKMLPGGGYTVGRVDAEGELTGNNIAFIYPDHRTGLLGHFEKGEMKKCQAVTVQGFETEYKCVSVPHFSEPTGEFFTKEVSTTSWVTENTMLEDPYEKVTVYVAHSKTPGADDGLFAARDLKMNTIAAFYNGIRRQKPADSATTWQENAYKIFDPTNKKGVIDILPKYQSLSCWQASLAHKTNHSFLPNCEFSEAFHPRWGLVPCLVTRQDVKRGEELLVLYGYDLDYCPDWYKDAWENNFNCISEADETMKSG